MKITVSKRFLRVPVKFDGTSHKFTFSENGTPVYKFDAVYTEENADAVYYADLRDYLGKTMTVTVEPECAFTPVFEDAMTPLTAEETVLRPQLHFTAERGWINDPNGLCFYGGQYHLFYQHNPYGRLWGNMHWGHAVSPDLLHWEYKEEAMFLDMDGAMFSGCAIVDHNNVSGLKEGDETPILFFYTCAGEKKSTQCLAYSTDGGKTLKKYDKNPLIDEIAPGNRDPKVIYDAKRARWLMALYFVERTYAIFTSQDLLHWELLQKFDLPGDDECPDLYPLTADDGRTLWVYSGAHDMYFVGDFDGDTFQCTEITNEPLWIDFGFDNYAGVTYGNYDRPVYLGWGVNPLYANFVPTGEYSGLMTLPRELSLCETEEGYRLKTKPFGIDEYRAGAFPIGNQKPLLTESFGLLVQGNFGRIALKNSRGEEVVIEVTVDSITVDRSKSGDLSYFDDVDPKLFKKEDLLVSTTKRYMRGNVNMEIIFDVSYLEIYADGGLETASVCVYPDAPYQVVSTDGDLEVKMYTIKK